MADDPQQSEIAAPAVLAHEIKNPLAAIRGASQLLQRKLPEADQGLARLVTDEVDRIARMIDRMQKLGSRQVDPLEPVNLHEVIRNALGVVRSVEGAPAVTFTEEFDPSLPPVIASKDALQQVMINLLGNARDACAGEEEPVVSIRTRYVTGLVMNVLRRGRGRAVSLPIEIAISDNGPGIDPAIAERVFEPFVTSKKGGQGLGLALVRKLVRDMDGRIAHERDRRVRPDPVPDPSCRSERRRMTEAKRILVVEDDPAIATVIVSALESEGYEVDRCAGIAGRNALLEGGRYAAMLTDVMLEDGDGIAALDTVRELAPSMPFIVLSAQNTLDTAVRASENEAFEYFPKPFDLDELLRAVRQAAGAGASAVADDAAGDGMPLVGRSQAMQAVFRMIARVLRNDLTVLVTGESGTGKELVAEAIHQLGHRKTGPFVAVNAAAIPHDLIESELFGHEKGAFTGATTQAIGKFEQANGGTLFLDEIGDMPVEAQTRLLRALQSGRIRRVGGRQDVAVNVRIVTATNRDLGPMIAAGTFREDLYYRLAVVPIELPPLRERREDIGMLANHFLGEAVEEGLAETGPYREGNRAALGASLAGQCARTAQYGVSSRNHGARGCDRPTIWLPKSRQIPPPRISRNCRTSRILVLRCPIGWKGQIPPEGTIHRKATAAFEKPLFEEVLRRTGGNQLRAAAMLGINRNTLRKRLGDLSIDAEMFTTRA